MFASPLSKAAVRTPGGLTAGGRGLRIVEALAQETGMSVANVSQHLNRLAMAGLVARRRDGKHVHYRIADPRLEELCDLVCAGVRERAELLTG